MIRNFRNIHSLKLMGRFRVSVFKSFRFRQYVNKASLKQSQAAGDGQCLLSDGWLRRASEIFMKLNEN